jgi:hypothetical protein
VLANRAQLDYNLPTAIASGGEQGMTDIKGGSVQADGGILVLAGTAQARAEAEHDVMDWLRVHGLEEVAELRHASDSDRPGLRLTLRPDLFEAWTPGYDTTRLHDELGLDTLTRPQDLETEVAVAMLASPVTFVFPHVPELLSSIRIRRYIVEAARQAVLAFDTVDAERPMDWWDYSDERGFTVKPGKPLREALQKATQPDHGERKWSFSCYRATEYVALIGLARELAVCNPQLAEDLQRQWETRAIVSGEFHEVFLREYGTMDAPLPLKFYVPGDRLWFRNPDPHSSDVEGYEGSWIFYLGNGLFNNFWTPTKVFSLQRKCLEIYHWRHATYRKPDGSLAVNDDIVDERVRETMADPQAVERIYSMMLKLREPQGVYKDGGCIDATRECLRWVHPGVSEITLPGR